MPTPEANTPNSSDARGEPLPPPVTHWETVAQNRWGSYITAVIRNALFRGVDLAGAPQKFLDIGCEGGRWAVLLCHRGWQAICTDINQSSLDVCQQRLPTAQCILVRPQDTSLPGQAGSVHLVLCLEVFPVIPTDWFIREAHRVLDDQGIVVGVFLNKCSVRGFLHHLVSVSRGKFDWYSRAYGEWKTAAEAQGFEILHEEGICWFPFRRDSNSPLVRPAVWLEKVLGLRSLPRFSPWIAFVARKCR